MTDSGADHYLETADIETASAGYAQRFAGNVGAWFLAIQSGLCQRLLPAPPMKLLDVGGGHGQLAIPLCAAGYDMMVIGSAESCRERIAHLADTGRCDFQVGDLVALPFKDNSFDAVLSFRLLPHCERWPQLIKELCRVSRGPVIVDYPAAQGLNRLAPALFSAKKSLEKNTRTWRDFQHAEINEAFANAGYHVTDRLPQFTLPMVLHRTLRCRRVSAILEGILRGIGLTRRVGSPVIIKAEPSP